MKLSSLWAISPVLRVLLVVVSVSLMSAGCTKPLKSHGEKYMAFVKGGCYEMGDRFGDGYADEKPVHRVCLVNFWLDRYEVTQQQFQLQTGMNPSAFKGCPDCPVDSVTWNEAREYCERAGKRLPTEAEWEYAATGGGLRERWSGTNIEIATNFSASKHALARFAWYKGHSGGKTHPVGQKRSNRLGLYDMSGNVFEWVHDWYGKNYYRKSVPYGPRGPARGDYRIVRGGSWAYEANYLRNSVRLRNLPGNRSDSNGFRCAE